MPGRASNTRDTASDSLSSETVPVPKVCTSIDTGRATPIA